jgi:hypothetical protein
MVFISWIPSHHLINQRQYFRNPSSLSLKETNRTHNLGQHEAITSMKRHMQVYGVNLIQLLRHEKI